jgi:hypothetical protein
MEHLKVKMPTVTETKRLNGQVGSDKFREWKKYTS